MSDTKLEKIIIIDDSADYRKLIKTFVNKLLPEVEFVEYDPVTEGVPDEQFNWGEYDVLLLDFQLSIVGVTGLDVLHKHHKKSDFPATIMLTGAGTEEIAIRALKTGIYKYQSKQTLTKDQLKQFIIHAWEDRKSKRIQEQEAERQKRIFSKDFFYARLKKDSENPDSNRVLLVMKPDNLEEMEKQVGIIGRDSLLSFIAKKSYEIFSLGACNPNITRVSDNAIGIQIDFPDSLNTFEHNMQGLCKSLSKATFKFSDESYPYSISIGIIKLGEVIASPQQLIEYASNSANIINNDNQNSYRIWQISDNEQANNSQENKTTQQTVSNGQQLDPEKNIEAEESRLKLEQELKEVAALKAKAQAELDAASATKSAAEEDAKKLALKQQQEAEQHAAIEKQKQLEAELKARAEIEEKLKKEAEEKAKLETELKNKQEQERLKEIALKAEAEAKARAEAEQRAEEEAKQRREAELKAEAEAKAKAALEAEIQAAKEAREKMEAELKAKQQEAEERARLEAELKANQEEQARLEEETRKRHEAELKAEAEAKAKAALESEILAAREEKAKMEAELKAKQQEAEEKAKLEAELKAHREKQAILEEEAAKRHEAELKAEAEAKAKAALEEEMQAAKEAREKMEAELKAIAEAKAKAEAEIEAVKAEKLKLESEIQTTKQANETVNVTTTDTINNEVVPEKAPEEVEQQKSNSPEQSSAEVETENLANIEQIVRQLLEENRLIQTYQPVVAMTDDDEETMEIFQTGISGFDNDLEVAKYLQQIATLSTELQQAITEFMLRQVFARITENVKEPKQNRFIINVTENWFTNIALFQWLQKILTQTKKYMPGKSIIINVPLPLYEQHQKRASALISTLHKTYHFQVAISQVEKSDTLHTELKSVFTKWLIIDMEVLKQLNTRKAVKEEENNENSDQPENKSPLELIKANNIHIATTGIEDATLLTEAITEGTDYVIGAFVGEVQESLSSSTSMESFELT